MYALFMVMYSSEPVLFIKHIIEIRLVKKLPIEMITLDW